MRILLDTHVILRWLTHDPQLRMTPLPISVAQAIRAAALEAEHRDPFDRMLIAQGQLESVPVVTGNSAFARFEVELIWCTGARRASRNTASDADKQPACVHADIGNACAERIAPSYLDRLLEFKAA